MEISKVLTRFGFTFFAGILLLFAVGEARAQTDSVKKIRLKSPATVTGTIGGESHNSYVIRVRRNQILRIQISIQGNDGNRAEFVVSRSGNFFTGDVIRGVSSDNDSKWYAKILKTGNYYIYVTGYPVATYTLKVSVK